MNANGNHTTHYDNITRPHTGPPVRVIPIIFGDPADVTM